MWYKTFRKDLKDIGFILNPYNPCVANKEGSRITTDNLVSRGQPQVKPQDEVGEQKI
jgi:hypothetical protein